MDSLGDLERRIREARAGYQEPPRAPRGRVELDKFIERYASELLFVRNLLENSLDAGAGRVDITLSLEPFEGMKTGALRIQIEDDGAGMDREAIDTRLTRLFNANRPGRAGIGFVSVFAFHPEAVIVDTQDWRVFFHGGKDKKFDRIPMEEKRVGTMVTLIKMIPIDSYEQLSGDLLGAARDAARYCEVPVFFEDALISQNEFSKTTGAYRRHGKFELVVEKSERPVGLFYSRGLLTARDENPGTDFSFRVNHPLFGRKMLEVNKDGTYHLAMRLLRETYRK